MYSSLRCLISIGAGLLLVLPSPAKKKEEPLSRTTPVAADQPIPISDFFRPYIFDTPKLNPAGTHFAAIVSTKDDRTDLVAFDLATMKAERLTGSDGIDINGYEWLNDNRLLFNCTRNKLYAEGLHAVELGQFNRSYLLERNNVMVLVGFPEAHPSEAICWIRQSVQEKGGDGGVIRIKTGHTSESSVSVNLGFEIAAEIAERYPAPKGVPLAYLADRNGELAFAMTGKDGVMTMHRYTDGKWERCSFDPDQVEIVGTGDKPGELLALGLKVEGKPRPLHRFDAVTGSYGELLFQDDKYDCVGFRLYRRATDHRILGIQYERKGPASIWFDENYASIQASMEKAFPDKVVRIIGSDRAEKHFFVSVFSDIQPATYYHFQPGTSVCEKIVNVAPWIDPKRMQPMHLITYQSRDGHEIEGYVTLPAGASKESPAPLLVLPHGGPWVRDHWRWNPEVQFLASRGYAVFQPNYRGSPGFAWRFPAQDDWAFLKMHDDVTDGVKTVLRTGLIDRDRIAIMGGSFGGYLALSGAVHENDLYRCAITIAGVFDWERVIKEAKGSEFARGNYGRLRRNLGDPKQVKEKFDEISPIKHIAQIKVPIFVAHGTDDPIASIAQSKQLISELKKQGVPYEKLIEVGEGHGFRQLDHQIALYSAIEAFLAKNLAPRVPPPKK